MIFNNDWSQYLKQETEEDYFKNMMEKVNDAYDTHTIYPKKEEIFNAFNFTSYKDTKVLLLGQDPYHGPNQAHGLCFSVNKGNKIPPSLRNIYKELNTDLGCYIPDHGYLKKWADQGILLLNTVLTVEEKKPNSHKKYGWQTFTDQVIKVLNDKEEPVIFILWGNNAIKKKALITNPIHHIIESVHPSPLSARRGFFDSKPFSKANDLLKLDYDYEIDWQIENDIPPLL